MSRLLVIEDNRDNIELMAYLIRAYGHDPLLAEDGTAGLKLARDIAPDLILLDIQLPGMDGYETLNALRAQSSLGETPIVAVTASAMVGDRERILAAGFDGYIPKPIAPESFVAEVERFLPVEQRPSSESTGAAR